MSEARQFTKKPVTITAAQWFKNGDHPEDYDKNVQGLEKGELREWSGMEARELGWEGQVVRYFRRPDVSGETLCRNCSQTMHVHGWIDTKEGGHIVCPGDWIITGVQGEKYPCKPGIFEATYSPVVAPSRSAAPEKENNEQFKDNSSRRVDSNLADDSRSGLLLSQKDFAVAMGGDERDYINTPEASAAPPSEREALEQQAAYYFSEIRKFSPLNLDHYSLENWEDFIVWREARAAVPQAAPREEVLEALKVAAAIMKAIHNLPQFIWLPGYEGKTFSEHLLHIQNVIRAAAVPAPPKEGK